MALLVVLASWLLSRNRITFWGLTRLSEGGAATVCAADTEVFPAAGMSSGLFSFRAGIEAQSRDI
jgi:hypothetical protein